ncbi:hypothetical protein LCGC14_0164070 [marine sediment metagenome]|uniref:Uncharacterized protein n=1 Tax=marine sediment metagenome TaxID=412755 RepID=A0A0F9XWK6_9ZZZZ
MIKIPQILNWILAVTAGTALIAAAQYHDSTFVCVIGGVLSVLGLIGLLKEMAGD